MIYIIRYIYIYIYIYIYVYVYVYIDIPKYSGIIPGYMNGLMGIYYGIRLWSTKLLHMWVKLYPFSGRNHFTIHSPAILGYPLVVTNSLLSYRGPSRNKASFSMAKRRILNHSFLIFTFTRLVFGQDSLTHLVHLISLRWTTNCQRWLGVFTVTSTGACGPADFRPKQSRYWTGASA